MGVAARSIRSAIPACWYGSKGRRPWPRPSMSWKSCAAICAGTCTRPPLRPKLARKSTMIAMLRYGSGFPWNRLEKLEDSLGIPLPAATQCEIMKETAVPLQTALEELKRQAAQGEVVNNDDTSLRVLSLDRDADISPERTGVFTSGLVWICQQRRIALYFHRVQARWRESGRGAETT